MVVHFQMFYMVNLTTLCSLLSINELLKIRKYVTSLYECLMIRDKLFALPNPGNPFTFDHVVLIM